MEKPIIFLVVESEIWSLEIVNVEESREIPEENESNNEFLSSAYSISLCGTEVKQLH